jgi:hypothetical protein
MKVNIHNQCSDFNLGNRKWFKTNSYWDMEPVVEVDAGSTMSAVLRSYLVEFGGAIMYQLQRKCVKSDEQLKSTSTLFCIAWKSEGYKTLRVFVQLIECDKTFDWYKLKLKEYYQRYANQLCAYTDPIEDTWLIHDGTILMTRLELDFTQRDNVLNVFISEGIKDEHTRRPVWLYPER